MTKIRLAVALLAAAAAGALLNLLAALLGGEYAAGGLYAVMASACAGAALWLWRSGGPGGRDRSS